jgi:hypothetical protein
MEQIENNKIGGVNGFWLSLPVPLALNIVKCIYFLLMGQSRIILPSKGDTLMSLSKMQAK